MALLIFLCLVWASTAAPLLPALKLKPLVTTPVGLLTEDTVQVDGMQAITVVFSRPVIALGADFGKEDAYGGKVPFSLSCSKLPGRSRWATTNIARFDPDSSWATDLDCTFSFNANLTSFDGVPLELEGSASGVHRLTTAPLTIQLRGVISEAASNATESVWSPTTGMPDDELPEVPEDARIILSFNNPVNLGMLQAALELKPMVPGLEIRVTPCTSLPPPVAVYTQLARSFPSSMKDSASNQDNNCVEVSLSKPLEVATAYQLLLPAGSSYNAPLSGPVAKDTGLQLAGLRTFRLPIRQNFQMLQEGSNEQAWDAVSSPYLLGWLPHGLGTDTSLDQFAAQLRICEPLNPFSEPLGACNNLEVASVKARDKKGLIVIHVPDLVSGRKYLLRVLPSDAILDSFGLPLQESKGAFWTQSARPFFQGPTLYPGSAAVLTPSAVPSLGWPFLTRGQFPGTTCSASVWHIDERTNVATLVRIMSGQRAKDGLVDQLGAPASVVQSPGEAGSEEVALMRLALDTSKKAHIVSYGCSKATLSGYRQRSGSLQLLLQVNMAASIILSPSNREVIAWVTDTSAAAAEPVVQGASVHIFLTRYQVAPRLAGTCMTNKDGWCRVALEEGASGNNLGRPVAVIVGPHGDILYFQKIGFLGKDDIQPYQATLVLDRLMVRPGDTLHVQGLVQKHGAKGKLEMPSRQAATLLVSPSWDQTANKPVHVVSDLSAEHGTLHARIPVPPAATPGKYSIQLLMDDPSKSSMSAAGDEDAFVEQKKSTSDGGAGIAELLQHTRALRQVQPLSSSKPTRGLASDEAKIPDRGAVVYPKAPLRSDQGLRHETVSIAFATITVADPRPPTAELTLEAPTWAKPDAPVQCKLRAVSYLGSQVAKASMVVTWNAGEAQGTLDVVTDSEGRGSFMVPLQDVQSSKAPASGDTLFVSVEWVGPTRERIVRDSETRLDAHSVRLDVGRSFDTDLPGVYFSPLVEVQSNEDGSATKGMPVSVTLAPAPQNCPSEGNAPASCGRVQECSIGSGEWLPQCRMALPCVGSYELKACTTDGRNASICSALKVGRNASEWAEEPLKAFDAPQLQVNASRLELGTVAGLSFENPWGGSVFVVWGNTVERLETRLITKVEPGRSQISIPAGAECIGGCTVMVLLASSQASGSCPDGVPVSRLFDCRSPVVHAMQTRLEVVQEHPVNVTLGIGKGAESGDSCQASRADVAVAAPGEDVPLCAKVQMGSEAMQDAEVTFIAVDAAALELLPFYPLQNLATAFEMDLTPRLSHAASEISRVHPGAVEAVFNTLARRLGLSPWVPLDTTVTPGSHGRLSPVDEGDEAFLSRQASAVTYMPTTDGCFSGMCPPFLMEAAFTAEGGAENFMAMDTAANPEAARGSTAAARGKGGVSDSPRMASDFVATPLFHVVRTTTNGTGMATFTAPSKLGTYIIRAYAVAKVGSQEAKYGQAESELVVRRKLSVTASMPRIVRMGDTFLAGVIVTAASTGDGKDFDATVSCEVLPPASGSTSSIVLTSDKDAKSLIKLAPEQPQQEVRFAFAAVALGNVTVRFSVVDDDGGASDTLLVTLPCLAPQQPVQISTSFAVRPGLNRTADAVQAQQTAEVQQSRAQRGGSAVSQAAQLHTEGMQLPSAVPGSGLLHLVAGFGHLPSIISSYESVAQSVASASYPRGRSSLVLATLPFVFRLYQQQLSTAQAANASKAAANLALLTHDRFGLVEFPPDEGLWNERTERTDTLLNAWASWVTCKGQSLAGHKLGSKEDEKVGVSLDLVSRWRRAIAQQLVLDAEEARNPRKLRKPEPYSDFHTLAWARLALGAHWHLPLCTNGKQDIAARKPIGETGGEGQELGVCSSTAQQSSKLGICASGPLIQNDLSLSALVTNASTQGMGVQLLVAILLEEAQQGPPSAPEQAAFVLQTADAVVSQIRVTARTAYVSMQRGSRNAAGFDVQALALWLLMHLSRPNEAALVQKLAAYVARQDVSKRSSIETPALNAPSPWAVALMVQALAAYDIAAGSSAADLRLLAAVDQRPILEVSFRPNNTDFVQVTVPWAQLPSNPGQLSIQAEGHGEATVAISLRFVPAALLRYPTYRGLWVESAVQAVDPVTGDPVGPALEGVPVGTVLAFTLQITTPDDLGPVTVDVLMPAGLEPVDPNLSTGGARVCALGDLEDAAWVAVRSWWPVCPTQETKPDAVQFHYQSMMAGTHTLEFMAVASTEGIFVLPSVKAFADNQAEVMGMTASRTLAICDDGCSPKAVNAQE